MKILLLAIDGMWTQIVLNKVHETLLPHQILNPIQVLKFWHAAEVLLEISKYSYKLVLVKVLLYVGLQRSSMYERERKISN